MMLIRKILVFNLFVLLGVLSYSVKAQEVNCRIQVNSSQIQGTDKSVFEEMQKGLYEFLNNYKWTNHVYTMEERVECSFLITITNTISSDEFKGSLQVTSTRPVYKSGYDSPMLNIVDKKVQFRYAEGQALEFSESSHNELTSLLAYYVYIVLGVDYDSFSSMGGTPFFQKAETIVSNAQSSNKPGWKSFEDRKNRYWLVENFLNPEYSALREYSYLFHRKGLDIMHDKPVDGRAVIASELSPLLKVHRQKPSSYIMQIFFDAKNDEFVKIFKESFPSEATRAYNILKEIDPGHVSKYESIIKKN